MYSPHQVSQNMYHYVKVTIPQYYPATCSQYELRAEVAVYSNLFLYFFFAFLVANEQAFDNTLPCHEQRLQYIVMSCPSQYVLKLYYMFINFNIICIHCNQVSHQIALS